MCVAFVPPARGAAQGGRAVAACSAHSAWVGSPRLTLELWDCIIASTRKCAAHELSPAASASGYGRDPRRSHVDVTLGPGGEMMRLLVLPIP